MDQDVLVNEQTESGKRLIKRLAESGFDVRLAFWAKPTDDGKWFLYLVSPFVDEKGALAAYLLVHDVMRKLPDPWIDSMDVKVVRVKDSLAEAASALVRPKVSNSPYAVQPPKPFPGMTRFRGSSLGGLSFDGALVYPPLQADAPASSKTPSWFGWKRNP